MQLIVVDPRSGRRKQYPLPPRGIRVGGAVDCDVVLPDAAIAGHALDVRLGGDGVVIEAVGASRFLLNEQATDAAILHVGDVVKLGPFQLVVAPAAAVVADAPPADDGDDAAAAAVDADADDDADADAGTPDPAAERMRTFAQRRSQKKREEVWLGVLLVVAAGGVLAWGAHLGWFRHVGKSREPEPGTSTGAPPAGAGESLRELTATPGVNEARGETPSLPFEVDPDSGEVFDPVSTSWRKESTAAEVAATLQKVGELVEVEEYARARWLLWRLTPPEAERASVEQRRREVDAATAKGGASHLAFVDELVKKGKIAAALSHCVEESIERFRGTETWYALLEKADEIEAIIDERVPEARRLTTRVKHARSRPADLERRPPPPARVTIAEEMREAQKPARTPSGGGRDRGERDGG
ncbi:MAG: hypothetical protein FJ293_12440, partial [Planctomycetes bacterium]|nr:hypothetical protein [Planctomycetota bacterium]